MSMQIVFPGGRRVEARHRGFSVMTDQPESAGGTNTALSPFELFLTSLGACAGFYVLAFCQKRGLATDGISLALDTVSSPASHGLDRVEIAITPPHDFPDEYVAACVRAADQCAVKSYVDAEKLPVRVRVQRAGS